MADLTPQGILTAAKKKVEDVKGGETDPSIVADLDTATRALDSAIGALTDREERLMREAFGSKR